MLASFFFQIEDHRRGQGRRYELGHILLFPSSNGFCGLRRNEAKLAKNNHGFSQYASMKVYRNKKKSTQALKADCFSYRTGKI